MNLQKVDIVENERISKVLRNLRNVTLDLFKGEEG